MKHSKVLFSALVCIALIVSAFSICVYASDAARFDYVLMNVGADETERNLVWKSQYKTDGYVMYARSQDGQMPSEYKIAKAVANTTATANSYSYMATMRGLTPGKYVYQLCVGDTKSALYPFEVYDTSEGFTFAFAADPQLSSSYDSPKWSDTLQKVYANFGDVALVVSGGDQGSNPFNEATAFGAFKVPELYGTPAATSVGPAHDNTPFYKDNYNLPNLSSNYGISTTSSDYFYTYEDVLFVHLNMDNSTHSEHIEFMKRAVADNPDCKWRIAVIHYAFFSAGNASQNTSVKPAREQLAGEINKLGFDMVLSGHDHVYSRSLSMLDGYTVSSDVVVNNTVTDPKGTTYITGTSSSGTKFYDIHYEADDKYLACRFEDNRKAMVIFDVTDAALTMNSYFLDKDTPELYDSFKIIKSDKEIEEPDFYNITYVADHTLSYGDDISEYKPRIFTSETPDAPTVPVPKGSIAEGVIYDWTWEYRNENGDVVNSFNYGEDYTAYLVSEETPVSGVMYIANTQDEDNMTYTWTNAFNLAAEYANQPITFVLKENIKLKTSDRVKVMFLSDVTLDLNGYTLDATVPEKVFRYEAQVSFVSAKLKFTSSKAGGKINAGSNNLIYLKTQYYSDFYFDFENVDVICSYLVYGEKNMRRESNVTLNITGGTFDISNGVLLVNNYDASTNPNNYKLTFKNATFNLASAPSAIIRGTENGYLSSTTSFVNAANCTFKDTYTSDNLQGAVFKEDIWKGTATFTGCNFDGTAIGKTMTNPTKITIGEGCTFSNTNDTFDGQNPLGFACEKAVCADGCVIARTGKTSAEIVKKANAAQITWANPVGYTEYWKKGTTPVYLGATSFNVGENEFSLVVSETPTAVSADKTYSFKSEEGYIFRLKDGTEIWQVSTDGGNTYQDITEDGLVETKYVMTVTVDGVDKNYTSVDDFMDIVTEYSADEYANKTINITFGDDLSWTKTGSFRPASGAKFNIDLAGYKLTIARGERISLARTNYYLAFFSSEKGGELVLDTTSDGFQIGRAGTFVFGSEEYKNNLTVTSAQYLLNMDGLTNGCVVNVKYLYSTFNTGTYGILRFNALGSDSVTMKAEMKGCTVNGSTSLIFYNSSTNLTATSNGGVFTTDSYLNFTDSSFTRTTSNPKNFFGNENLTDRYFGTVRFENCTFNKYILNGDMIRSDEALSYNTYYSTLTGYDPSKQITVGEGCVFRNYSTTFNSDKTDFAASNTNVADNCKLLAADDYVMVVSNNGVVIDLGEKSNASNIRFVEIDGVQKQVNERLYIVPEDSGNVLIEVVEKANADTSVIIKSEYYFADMSNKTYTKLNMDSFMTTDGKNSIRTKDPMGIRFKYSARKDAKFEKDEFVIDEIGFIIAVTDRLGDEELTFDYDRYVAGVSYNKADGKDIVFDGNDESDIFTCVVKNIPVKEYKTNLTCKTYTKISIGDEQFIVYSEAVVGNIYDTAQKLLETDPSNFELLKIVLDADYSIGVDIEDLYD